MEKRVFFGLMILVSIFSMLHSNPIYNRDIKRLRKMNLKQLEAEVNRNQSSPTPYVELGDRYLRKKEYKKAETMFLKAKAINPEFRFAYEGLGKIYIEWERYDEAIACFEKAIQKKSLHFVAYRYLAAIYKEHLNNRDKAIEVLQTFEEHLMKYGKQDEKSKRKYYRELSRMYNKIDEPELGLSLLYKGGMLDQNSIDDKFAHARIYANRKEIDKAEQIIRSIIDSTDYSFYHYKRILSFYKNGLKDNEKAISFLNKFIAEMDSQPPSQTSFVNYKIMNSICKGYNIAYDYKGRMDKEIKRILDYLKALPDSAIIEYRKKEVLSMEVKKSFQANWHNEIINPEQAEYLLIKPLPGSSIYMSDFDKQYTRELLKYHVKTTGGARIFAPVYMTYSKGEEAVSMAEHLLIFSSDIALDSFWLAEMIDHHDKDTGIYLYRKALEYDPASIHSAVALINLYVNKDLNEKAEKVCLDFLQVEPEIFENREFPDSVHNNSYFPETEFLSKIMIYYKLTRLYAYYYPDKASNTRDIVKQMETFFNSGTDSEQCRRAYLLMARAYRVIDDNMKAEELYERGIAKYPDYWKLESEQKDLKKHHNSNLRNKKQYIEIPLRKKPQEIFMDLPPKGFDNE